MAAGTCTEAASFNSSAHFRLRFNFGELVPYLPKDSREIFLYLMTGSFMSKVRLKKSFQEHGR